MVRRRRTAKPSGIGYGNCYLDSSEAECNRGSSSFRFNKPGNTAADAAALAPLPSCLLAWVRYGQVGRTTLNSLAGSLTCS